MSAELPLASMLLLLFSFLFTKRYAHPSTPHFVVLILSVSFYLGFYGSALLPVDLAATANVDFAANNTNTGDVVAYDETIMNMWNFFYWSTFLLRYGKNR